MGMESIPHVHGCRECLSLSFLCNNVSRGPDNPCDISRRQVNATYAGFTNTPDYNPTSSDVTSSTRPQKVNSYYIHPPNLLSNLTSDVVTVILLVQSIDLLWFCPCDVACSHSNACPWLLCSEFVIVFLQILVLGGSGFVGTEVCKAAILQGISVVSLSRSGRPSSSAPWADRVTWVAGKPVVIQSLKSWF